MLKSYKTSIFGILAGIAISCEILFPEYAVIIKPISAAFISMIGIKAMDEK